MLPSFYFVDTFTLPLSPNADWKVEGIWNLGFSRARNASQDKVAFPID